jgi:RNA polymerase sigma-70 factor (ECF subfamily)
VAELSNTKSGADLVRRIRADDPRAEEELVQRYSRGVSTIINRATGNRPDAEDLCQETFRIALEKIRQGDVREPEKLSGFICSLARNLVIDYYRRESRLKRQEDIKIARQLPDSAPSPLDQLVQKEEASIVRQVLNELKPDRDREVLFRFYVAEDDKDQICADLGLSSLHFNRVLYRARQRFRELYEKNVRRKT